MDHHVANDLPPLLSDSDSESIAVCISDKRGKQPFSTYIRKNPYPMSQPVSSKQHKPWKRSMSEAAEGKRRHKAETVGKSHTVPPANDIAKTANKDPNLPHNDETNGTSHSAATTNNTVSTTNHDTAISTSHSAVTTTQEPIAIATNKVPSLTQLMKRAPRSSSGAEQMDKSNLKKPHHDPEFFHVAVTIEDIVYHVPYLALIEAKALEQAYTRPGDESKSINLSDESFGSNEFRDFLKVLVGMPRHMDDYNLSHTELENALEVANQLQCDSAREDAIDRIDELGLGPARKIQLARRHNVAKWYGPEIVRLVFRPEDWTVEEGKQLGWEITSLVSSLQRMHPMDKVKVTERVVEFCDTKASEFNEDELKIVLEEMEQNIDEGEETEQSIDDELEEDEEQSVKDTEMEQSLEGKEETELRVDDEEVVAPESKKDQSESPTKKRRID